MIEQGSAAWMAARIGRVTASRIADVIAKTKTGYSASRQNYMAELAIERLTGVKAEGYTNDAMKWGVEHEADARSMYEFMSGNSVEQCGFIDHETLTSGASPDGLVGDDGLLEIKCPNSATHIEYLLSGEVPSRYKPQMTWQMICAKRKWCDFVSFDPRMPGNLQYFCKRYEFDSGYAAELVSEVAAFLKDLDALVEKLRALQ